MPDRRRRRVALGVVALTALVAGGALYFQVSRPTSQRMAGVFSGDVGETWREQLDIPNIEAVLDELLGDIKPLYRLLHGYVRHRLGMFYGEEVVSPFEPIPAHLLGM